MVLDDLKVTPLTPRIGAEIGGVDLARASPRDAGRIRQALVEHQVVFFRDQQNLDHESLKRLGLLFGELAIHSGVAGMPGHPELVAIHADADSRFIAGDDWHSDLTCDAAPPMGSILYLHTVPPDGGDTLFSSMYAAYDALSPRMKAYLEGLTAVHDADHVYRPLFPDLDRKYPCNIHPVVRTHPESGRKGLFVNASYVLKIVELPELESAAVLDFLYRHCANPNFQVRFRWRPHSVAFWDNRCTQHMAVWDYFPQTRSGYRVTVAGEKPV
ncbi:MAG TPA: TauD/TfdA family dioxygenase [Caulobacteraceae bacterium]|jgi:taurine dioxygenase|nr:TauD/TfdA family dioxygenase [Caulobacteraceae bacterium]